MKIGYPRPKRAKFALLFFLIALSILFVGCKAALVDDLKGYYDESGTWHEEGELTDDQVYDVWYYSIEAESSPGNRADIYSCVSSTGEHVSPGIVSTPWRSVNYARPRNLPPMEIGIQAYLAGNPRPGIPADELGTGRLAARIILNGEVVATAIDYGTIFDCSATPTFMIGTVPTYSMIYDPNGASDGLPPLDETKYEAGDTVRIARGGYLLEKSGYSFLGWSTESGGGGYLYQSDEPLFMPDHDVRLYAVWTSSPTWMVRYDGNGNTAGSAPDPEKCPIGEDCPIIWNAWGMEKDGFRLAGWNTKADGSGMSVAIYASLAEQTPETTLYALWLDENLKSEGTGNTIRITGYESPPSGELRIPRGITEIGNLSPTALGPFVGCDGITSITMPDSLTSIGAHAFENCRGLSELRLPDSVKAIGGWAFKGCVNLGSLDLGDDIQIIGGESFKACDSLESVIIPSGVVSLGSAAFLSCDSLSSVVFERVVEDIGTGVFADCDLLTSVILPGGLEEIPHSMFYHCDGLSAIDIPSSVTEIGQIAFAYCTSLSSIDLPDELLTIGKYAFEYCSSLSAITIPQGVKNMGEHAFYEAGLSEVYLTEGLETIGINFFSSCANLRSIVLPSSLKQLGGGCFNLCSSLSDVFFKSILPPEHSPYTSFLRCSPSLKIHVPSGSLGSYSTAPYWSYFVANHTYALVSP
jgi:hypothetical protein